VAEHDRDSSSVPSKTTKIWLAKRAAFALLARMISANASPVVLLYVACVMA